MSRKFLDDIEITAGIKITSGTPGAGKVLTSDTDGDATWEDSASGGDVDGPASATDNAVARYDSTTGKIIQNSSAILADNGDLTLVGDIVTSGAAAADALKIEVENTDDTGAAALNLYSDTASILRNAYGSAFGAPNENTVVDRIDDADAYRMSFDGVDKYRLNSDGTLQLPAYGAGVLTSDGSGNITSVSGGSGITAAEAIAYAIALG